MPLGPSGARFMGFPPPPTTDLVNPVISEGGESLVNPVHPAGAMKTSVAGAGRYNLKREVTDGRTVER